MGYIFRPGITACLPGATLIFLDIAGDRYFALGDAPSAACLRLITGEAAAKDDPAILDGLVGRGILRRVDSDARPRLCPPAANIRCCALDTGGIARPAAVSAALARLAIAIVELKIRPLASVLGRFARAKLRMSRERSAASNAASIAAAFADADRFLAAFDRCLPRSLALTRSMLAAGLAPELILGVKLRPFEAHCWVQLGECLVSDTPAAIAPFTPILIL